MWQRANVHAVTAMLVTPELRPLNSEVAKIAPAWQAQPEGPTVLLLQSANAQPVMMALHPSVKLNAPPLAIKLPSKLELLKLESVSRTVLYAARSVPPVALPC